MRKFTFAYFVFLIVITCFSFVKPVSESGVMDKVTLYFVDKQMMKLVGTEYYITQTSAENEVKTVIAELLKGRDENTMIRRMLPNYSDAITVKIDKGVAYININTKYISEYEVGKEQEELTVYQLVNSVASVGGVSRVKFLFDGKEQKKFLHSLDMREAFIPDYSI